MKNGNNKLNKQTFVECLNFALQDIVGQRLDDNQDGSPDFSCIEVSREHSEKLTVFLSNGQQFSVSFNDVTPANAKPQPRELSELPMGKEDLQYSTRR